MKRQHIHLSDKQVVALKQLAEQTGISLSEIIRRAIDEFIVSHTRHGAKPTL
jgi:predicted transcriptional regulator